MTELGSTATTVSAGSYEPAPAPTFTTLVVPDSADATCAAILGSGLRVVRYPAPIRS
jgi:hypothetical protein